MSNIFTELQKEAEKQQEEASMLKNRQDVPLDEKTKREKQDSVHNRIVRRPLEHSNVGTVAPNVGTVAPQLDIKKLETVVKELSTISTRRDGLNVRLSEIETIDIDNFINDKLRQKGIRGNDVSASKIMRYAFRYVLRVHEKEFIEALSRALRVKEELTI